MRNHCSTASSSFRILNIIRNIPDSRRGLLTTTIFIMMPPFRYIPVYSVLGKLVHAFFHYDHIIIKKSGQFGLLPGLFNPYISLMMPLIDEHPHGIINMILLRINFIVCSLYTLFHLFLRKKPPMDSCTFFTFSTKQSFALGSFHINEHTAMYPNSRF